MSGTIHNRFFKNNGDGTFSELADMNGGNYPITLYTKPGDTSGTLYGKVVNKVGLKYEGMFQLI